MSAYSKFKKCIGVAMGKKEAQAMKNAVDSGDDTGGASPGASREPAEVIQDQANKIADCIGIYMVKRSTEVDGKDVVRTPSRAPDDWPEGV